LSSGDNLGKTGYAICYLKGSKLDNTTRGVRFGELESIALFGFAEDVADR
jgi:hypothetical protein